MWVALRELNYSSTLRRRRSRLITGERRFTAKIRYSGS
jgi:hypothetical protein